MAVRFGDQESGGAVRYRDRMSIPRNGEVLDRQRESFLKPRHPID